MLNWIDDIVAGLLDRYDTNNVYEICEYEDIRIVKLDPGNILLRKKDAFYYRDLEDSEVIFIRNDLHPSLEQFILKHELGHALCHPDLLCANYSFLNIGKLEKQANYFALKLSSIVFDEVELYQMNLEQIACCLEIPKAALNQLVNFFIDKGEGL